MRLIGRKCSIAAIVMSCAFGAYSVELVVNGGFESNGGVGGATFSNWTVVRENADSGVTGNFFVQSGVRSPLARLDVPVPPAGTFTAMTDQTGPGRTALYQDIALPATGQMWLAMRLFVINQSDDFAAPATLDFTVAPNQQVRVDVMDPAAPLWDVDSGVLSNVLVTPQNYAQVGNFIPLSINLAAFAGRTVRVRIAEVDNRHGLVVGVDRVSATHVPVGTCAPVRPRDGGGACNLDLDGDGLLTANDALIATRYLLGFRDAALAQGMAFNSCATNTSAAGLNAAGAALAAGAPPPLDIDGDGVALGSTDGLLLVRSLLGVTGTAATTGAVASPGGASRVTWAAARNYLNSMCLAGVL